MANKIKDFVLTASLSALAEESEDHISSLDVAKHRLEEARRWFEVQTNLYKLNEEYRSTYASMMHKLFSATSHEESQKIRANFNNKLAPIVEKIQHFEKIVNDKALPPPGAASKSVIEQQLESARKLFSALDNMTNKAEVPAQVLLPPVEVKG